MKAELNPESSKQGVEEKKGGKDTPSGVGQPAEGSLEESSSEPVVEETGEGKYSTGIKVEYIPLDLSSFQSTIDCVRTFKEKNLPLHILINNAAIAFTPYSECALNQ